MDTMDQEKCPEITSESLNVKDGDKDLPMPMGDKNTNTANSEQPTVLADEVPCEVPLADAPAPSSDTEPNTKLVKNECKSAETSESGTKSEQSQEQNPDLDSDDKVKAESNDGTKASIKEDGKENDISRDNVTEGDENMVEESTVPNVEVEIKDAVVKEQLPDGVTPKVNDALYREEKDEYDSDVSSSSISDDSSFLISSDDEPDVPVVPKVIPKEQGQDQKKKKNKGKNRDAFEVDIRTKGELTLDELPPIEELKIDVDDTVSLVELGLVQSLLGPVVIIQSLKGIPAVDQDTIVFTEDRLPVGQVFETFGPVPQPLYVVRFNSAADLEKRGLETGQKIMYAPNMQAYTHFVFVEQLRTLRGSDASWEHNNEPPAKFLDYSDDEEERKAKGKGRRGGGGGGDDEDEGANDTKRHKKSKPRQPRGDGGQSHPGRPFNQSSGNQWPPKSSGNQWPPKSAPGPQDRMGTPRWPAQNPVFRYMGPRGDMPPMNPWSAPLRVPMPPRGRTAWEQGPVFEQSWAPPQSHPVHWPPNNPAQTMPMDYRFMQHTENEADFNQVYTMMPHQQQPRRPGPGPRPQFGRMPMPNQFGGAPNFPRFSSGWNG